MAGGDAAAALSHRCGQKAEARRKGEPFPDNVDIVTVDELRSRLWADGSVALLAVDAGEPVAGCFATQALSTHAPVPGLAHVSGLSVLPHRWGEGLGRRVLATLEGVLLDRGYITAQLVVLEANVRARRLYDLAGWRLARIGEPHPAGPQVVYEKTLS